jgi:hypothetical protein
MNQSAATKWISLFSAVLLVLGSLAWLVNSLDGSTPARSKRPQPAQPATVEDVREAPAKLPPMATFEKRLATVFRCELNNKVTYASEPCVGALSTAVAMHDSKGIEGAGRLERNMPRYNPNAIPEPLPGTQVHAISASNSLSPVCRLLEQQIHGIDAAARAAQSREIQDRLREERRHARDQQFAMHCG